ncbi:carbohydrate ABC transporter substrate-binding protein [Erysipelothrix rhusiopathiae]|nr:carbohydrate ABC transporter substrate-binding protein [Erysipelothrix rhusiopathiae]MDE8204463.1 carbohydrate ABC transporter substrate-binding protein [Erysipelothrix rhusiopathiae]MDE8301611.1 carbohydrate ABC transporter substrate-binding protein [Erysipelothrix rhusiopathiae]MDE8306703.1 carbohydrate ABC transporter substrate-binding protein [Erysipelothrix rhusiopathiae]
MKKMLVICLTALLILTGCGEKKDTASNEGKVLKVAGLNSGYGTEGFKKVVEAFEEAKGDGTKVELVLEKNIAEVLRPQIQSGDVPDVIYLAIGSEGKLTDTMISEKKIMDISDIMDMNVFGESVKLKDKINVGVQDTMRTSPYGDGKTYLAPVFYAPTGLFYNQTLFTEKGWTVPETWEEMFALGELAKAEDISLFTYPTTGYFDAFFSSILNNMVGPEKFEKLMNYDFETWKDPQVKETFNLVGKLLTYTHPDTVAQANGEGFTKNQQLILDNKALFIPNGTWLAGEMEKAPRTEGFKWGLTTAPVRTKGDATYATTFAEEMYIPEGAKNVDLAKEFLTFVYSDKAVELFANNGNAIQPVKGSSDLITDEQTKDFYAIYGRGVIASSVGFAAKDPVEGVDLTSGDGILYGTVNDVVSGQKTAEQWYQEVLDAVSKYQ